MTLELELVSAQTIKLSSLYWSLMISFQCFYFIEVASLKSTQYFLIALAFVLFQFAEEAKLES